MNIQKFIPRVLIIPALFTNFLTLTSCSDSAKRNPALDTDPNTTFPASMPPDPGKEGNRTVLGIDADKDGVRDDVQRWIFARHPTDVYKRNALRQLAKYYQGNMLVHPDEPAITAMAMRMKRGLNCLRKRFPENYQDSSELAYLMAKTINTRARLKVRIQNSSRLTMADMNQKISDTEVTCDE